MVQALEIDQITRAFDQVWTIGAGWAQPSEKTFGPGLDAETVLTAGHCVFNRRFNWGWAREIWVLPGWDGEGNIIVPFEYGNAWSLRLGVRVHPLPLLALRAGYLFESNAIPDESTPIEPRS